MAFDKTNFGRCGWLLYVIDEEGEWEVVGGEGSHLVVRRKLVRSP